MRRGGRRLGGLVHMGIDYFSFFNLGRLCKNDLPCKLDVERLQIRVNL